MNNPELDIALRIKCADSLLPYLEAKLKQIEVTGPDQGPVEIIYRWDEDSTGENDDL